MLLAYDKVDKPRCAAGVVSYRRAANYKDYLAQNQESNFEHWKISGLSVAIPALINVDKSGPNHLKSLIFFERTLSPYNGVVCAAWRPLFGDNRTQTPTSMLMLQPSVTGAQHHGRWRRW
jgi:hypothetical protein